MKNLKQTSSIVSGLLIKLAIILMLLLVASYAKLRLDFSQNRVYSLSPVSKEAVKGLKDNMVVKLYTSSELPAEMSSLDRYVKDLLSEYQMAGKGKFHYEMIRGLSMEELRTQAQLNGLKSMFFRIFENDKTTNKEVIYGLVFEYQGNVDALNLMPRTEAKLEYELTLKIQKLSRYTLPKIGIYADTLYSALPNDIFEAALNANYNVVSTKLLSPVEQTKVLIFPGTVDSLSQGQLYNLDQYLMKGGQLVVLQDKVASNGKNILALDSNIFRFLEHFGIGFSDAIAMDIFCDVRQMGVDSNISFPIYPVLRGSQHPITRNISDIVMYMPSGIIFQNTPGLKFETILATSPSSALLEGPDYEIDPELFQKPDPEVFKHPPIPLGGIVQGRMPSYFADKPQYQMPGFVSENEQGRIVVYGDRELYVDADKSIYQDRNYVVLNAVDWLLDRDSMINIRSRHMQSSILNIPYFMNKHQIVWGDQNKIERRIKFVVKLISIVLPSLMLITIGGLLALRRKQMQVEADETQ